MDAIRGRADPNTQRGEMKLIDENGEQWETIDGKDFNSFIIRKVKKPINPMPELRPGMIVRRREFNSGQKPEVIIIQEVNEPGLFTGINISRGWNRECFCQQQVVEVCYPQTIDIIWSREP